MKILFTLAAAGIMAFSAAAAAMNYNNQETAIDMYGSNIQDNRGDCVYTKWESAQGGCRAPLAGVIYFDFNKSAVKPSERAKLDALVARVSGASNVSSVSIVGHADRIGASAYNVRLSQKRATAVRNYLAARGVKVRDIQMRAVGESEPVAACDTSLPRNQLIACLAQDRRVEVVLNYQQ